MIARLPKGSGDKAYLPFSASSVEQGFLVYAGFSLVKRTTKKNKN